MTELKLVRIDDGVETPVWRGTWNGLEPTFLRCGWQTMFNANLPPGPTRCGRSSKQAAPDHLRMARSLTTTHRNGAADDG
jgi:hypothetical protein